MFIDWGFFVRSLKLCASHFFCRWISSCTHDWIFPLDKTASNATTGRVCARVSVLPEMLRFRDSREITFEVLPFLLDLISASYLSVHWNLFLSPFDLVYTYSFYLTFSFRVNYKFVLSKGIMSRTKWRQIVISYGLC